MAELEYINQGEFTQQIKLQEGIITKDSKSSSVRTFVTKYDAYAKVTETNTPEAISNEALRGKNLISVITYSAPVTNRWRIIWAENTYDVMTVTAIYRTPFIKIEAIKL